MLLNVKFFVWFTDHETYCVLIHWQPDDIPDVITIASSKSGSPGAMKSPASSEKKAHTMEG